MKKSFKLENLDCAHCAANMETAINHIDGAKANISFMSQRLTLEADEEKFEEVLEKAKKAISKIEPACCIVK